MRSILKNPAVLALASLWALACNLAGPTYPPEPITGQNFPIGHIDSPYMMPDGSAIYFLHSPVTTYGFLGSSVPWSTPASQPLPGHQGTKTLNWYNTDLYVSERNPGGDYGRPLNLGTAINSEHLECCPWVNEDQTILIFSREAFAHDSSRTGTYVSRRSSKKAQWGEPQRLDGELGRYSESRGIHDIHLTPSGDAYAWSNSEGPSLFFAEAKGADSWRWGPVQHPAGIDPKRGASQPWVNDAETLLCFNRWNETDDRELSCAERSHRGEAWGPTRDMKLHGFRDPAGRGIWGEPSFTRGGDLVFVRFDTSRSGWPAILMIAPRNRDGSYGPPRLLPFSF